MRTAFIETLVELAEKDGNICLLTGDLGFTVLERFQKAHPDRFFNVGVAEADMMGLATGLALDGWKPYVYSIATFASMRGYEQVRNGPVLHNLPVRILGIGGGFAYGHAGMTHYALEDYAILGAQPGLAVVAPADPAQTRTAVQKTLDLPGPAYFRIGKGGDPAVPGLDGRFKMDSVETVGEGRDVLILATGGIAADAVAVSQELGCATVGVVAVLNPAPVEALRRLIPAFRAVVTVEEHYGRGGLGSLVAGVIAKEGMRVAFRPLGVRDVQAGVSGSRDFMLKRCGLDRAALAASVRALLEKKGT